MAKQIAYFNALDPDDRGILKLKRQLDELEKRVKKLEGD